VMSRLANTIKTNADAEQVRLVASWMERQQRIIDGEIMRLFKLHDSEFEEVFDATDLFKTQNSTMPVSY
jgi:hypothetical protein